MQHELFSYHIKHRTPSHTNTRQYLGSNHAYYYYPIFKHVWHDSSISSNTHSYACHILMDVCTQFRHADISKKSYVWRDSFVSDMTNSYAWHIPIDMSAQTTRTNITRIFLRVTRPIHIWHDSFMTHSWLTHIRGRFPSIFGLNSGLLILSKIKILEVHGRKKIPKSQLANRCATLTQSSEFTTISNFVMLSKSTMLTTSLNLLC